MTNQTILSLLNYLCNEARNSVHATFGLMALCPNMAPDPGWQTSLENSKHSSDRLLRCIDDIRELLATETPAFDPTENFDIALLLGETIEVLNLASRDRASRLILESAGAGAQWKAASAGGGAGADAYLGRRIETRPKRGRDGLRRPGHRGRWCRDPDCTLEPRYRCAHRGLVERRSGPDRRSGPRRSAVRGSHAGGRKTHSRLGRNRGIRVRSSRAHVPGHLTSLASRYGKRSPAGGRPRG